MSEREQLFAGVQIALEREGHRVEVSTAGFGFPLMFRINGGPELTERQFMQEAGRMLAGLSAQGQRP